MQVQHTIHGVVGKPFIIVVPESKLKVMPVGELRQIMREAMAPFLKVRVPFPPRVKKEIVYLIGRLAVQGGRRRLVLNFFDEQSMH